MNVTFTLADAQHGAPATICLELTEALALNLISVARQVDTLVEWDEDCDTFEKSVVAALGGLRCTGRCSCGGHSVRSLDSVLAEMRSWAEDEDHLVVWDRDQWCFAICPDPAGMGVSS
jgi:hypothetical protein